MTDVPPDPVPASLRVALEAPPVPAKPWQDGIAPAFITLFLSVVFLDRLAPTTLFVGGLGPSCLGAGLAGLLGYWGLYYAPAMWGAATRQPLAVVASSTFGARGAACVPGLLVGLVYVVWFAITIDYATQFGLGGLVSCGLIAPKHLAMTTRGPFPMPSPVFLFVAASWSIASAIIGMLAVRLVAAIMTVYPVFPAIALGLALMWAMPTVGAGPVAAHPLDSGGGLAMATMVQLILGFLACHGLTAADWGAATPSTRDARLGGLVGVMLSAPILATLSLLIVAGAIGRAPAPSPVAAAMPPDPIGSMRRPAMPRMIPSPHRPSAPAEVAGPRISTLRDVFLVGIGGRLGAAGLLILALALIGPACSIPYVIARQFAPLRPRVPRWRWSLLGAVATWPLIASGTSRQLEFLFGLLGALTAPAVGAIAADYSRMRGKWPGPRRGVNWAGMASWLLGVIAAPIVVAFSRLNPMARFVPPVVVSFLVAFVAYLVLARLGLEPQAIPWPADEPSNPESAINPGALEVTSG